MPAFAFCSKCALLIKGGVLSIITVSSKSQRGRQMTFIAKTSADNLSGITKLDYMGTKSRALGVLMAIAENNPANALADAGAHAAQTRY